MTDGKYVNNDQFLETLISFQKDNWEEHSTWFEKMDPVKKAELDIAKINKKLKSDIKKLKFKGEKLEKAIKKLEQKAQNRITIVRNKCEDQLKFKEACRKRLEQRIVNLANEEEQHRYKRLKRVDRYKNILGRSFLKITEGLCKKPCFINYDQSRKQEMMSDATYFMTIYIDRYNCERDNPFAYFTQIAYNAFLQNINRVNKNREMFTSLNYIENLDSQEVDVIYE